MPINTFTDGEVIDAQRQNENWALAVLTDTARTITVTHTWTASQTFTGGWTAGAACTVTSSSATALAVGLNGATNPALQVDASTASSATGLEVKSAAATGGLALAVISSGTNENLTLDAKGSGTVTVNATGTGNIVLARATTLSLGGTITTGGFTVTAGGLFVTAGSAWVGATTTNAKMTLGLTIDQGSNNDEITSWKASAVAHGMTSVTENNTFGFVTKLDPSEGGMTIQGLAEASTPGMRLIGSNTNGDTTKSTAALGKVELWGRDKSGTGAGAMAGNTNVVVIRNSGTTTHIFDSDGDSHQDVGTAWTNFDTHDDVALLNLMAAHVTRKDDPLRKSFGQFLKQNRKELERVKLVTFNRNGHHFVNMSRLAMLHTGALRQLGAQVAETRAAIRKINPKLLAA